MSDINGLISYSGPPLDQGPLPAFIYFAVTGEESLNLDPFNQPITSLQEAPLRCFSWTIPGHGEDLPNKEALRKWAEAIENDHNFVKDFISLSQVYIDELIQKEMINPEKIAVGGLSRGGFLASHLAAEDARIHSLLAFAPLTTLATIQHFQPLLNHPLVKSLALTSIVEKLTQKNVRFYIGNHDTLVKTRNCFEFVEHLAKTAYEQGVRSPQAELIISPSIGYKGHGTATHIFADGANWIKERLL